MKKYTRLKDGKIYSENDTLSPDEKWADGSYKTVKEMVKLDPEDWEELYEVNREEVFELFKTFAIAELQGGKTFVFDDLWEICEMVIKKRDGVI